MKHTWAAAWLRRTPQSFCCLPGDPIANRELWPTAAIHHPERDAHGTSLAWGEVQIQTPKLGSLLSIKPKNHQRTAMSQGSVCMYIMYQEMEDLTNVE
jgi:hypothetical protein